MLIPSALCKRRKVWPNDTTRKYTGVSCVCGLNFVGIKNFRYILGEI